MWPFTNNSSRNEAKKMKKIVVYAVETEVTSNDDGDWKRKVRQIRKDLKTVIASHEGNRVLKIGSLVKE